MKKLYRQFLYVPKHCKMPEKVYRTRICLSLFAILLVCVLFCSAAVAYFNSSKTYDVATINSAYYNVSVTIPNETAGSTGEITAPGYTETNNSGTSSADVVNNNRATLGLQASDLHYFTITASGTASKGYVGIFVNDRTSAFYNITLSPRNSPITLCIKAAKETIIDFKGFWGECPDSQSTNIMLIANEDGECEYLDPAGYEDCDLYISETPHYDYTVQSGATLSEIAEFYGVQLADICIYNGINLEDASSITTGDLLKIPTPQVWEDYIPQTDEETEDGEGEGSESESDLNQEENTDIGSDNNKETGEKEDSDAADNAVGDENNGAGRDNINDEDGAKKPSDSSDNTNDGAENGAETEPGTSDETATGTETSGAPDASATGNLPEGEQEEPVKDEKEEQADAQTGGLNSSDNNQTEPPLQPKPDSLPKEETDAEPEDEGNNDTSLKQGESTEIEK